MKWKKIFIDCDCKQFRPFISVSDIIKIYKHLIKNNYLPSFICNLVSFNATVSTIAKSVCKILKINENLIYFKEKSVDKRNYIVGSKNFKKYFGKNFKFSSFSREVKFLKKNMIKHKIKNNNQTIRMKFYKRKLF